MPPDLESHDSHYDPLQADAYAKHLAEVNKSNKVVAATDILNTQGMLLVKKGQPLSAEAVARIVQFKLLRPLEASIEITDALTAEKLVTLFEESLLDDHTKAMYAASVAPEVVEFCLAFFQYPLLAQKLTVLWLQMPKEFHKSITVAWTSLASAQQMRLTKEERLQLFLAALVHDIGMLHIPSEITSQAGSLTPEQWRAVTSHTVIGQKILEQVKGLPPGVVKAVFEHHEMADGTGYPTGKFGADISVISQLIGLFDSIFAIFFNKLMPKKLSMRFIVPILQINSSSYRPDVFNAVIAGLREYKHAVVPMVQREQCEAFVAGLAAEAEILDSYRTGVFAIADMMISAGVNKHRLVRAAQTLSQQLGILLRSSGILDSSYFVSLLQELKNATPESESDLEETYLMLQELRFQFLKLTRICLAITENEKIFAVEQRATFVQALSSLPPLDSR